MVRLRVAEQVGEHFGKRRRLIGAERLANAVGHHLPGSRPGYLLEILMRIFGRRGCPAALSGVPLKYILYRDHPIHDSLQKTRKAGAAGARLRLKLPPDALPPVPDRAADLVPNAVGMLAHVVGFELRFGAGPGLSFEPGVARHPISV